MHFFFSSDYGRYVKMLLMIGLLNYLCPMVMAQSYLRKENNIWVGPSDYWTSGGQGLGVDFNSGIPQSFFTAWQVGSPGTINLINGGDHCATASVCDREGNLLFYTDGTMVWNRNHMVMQNGFDINNNGNMAPNTYYVEPIFGASTFNRDGVLIMPVPGSSHKYYIFSSPYLYLSTFPLIQQWEGRIYCTVVDMELANGLGAVDPAFRGVKIAESEAGNLHAVTGEDCNYWLLSYHSSGSYHAFNVTAAGIDTIPVVSTLSPLLSPNVFELNVSPNRRKVALAAGNEIQVCDFDPATGIFSNDQFIGGQQSRFVAFSPNNNLLYTSGIVGVRQFDLTSLTFTLLTINNMTGFEFNSPLKLAPDNKIYYSYLGSMNNNFGHYSSSIQQPNVVGPGCQAGLLTTPIPLLDELIRQLPNEVPVVIYDTVSSVKEVALCFGRPALLDPGITGTDYHWMANTAGITYLREGTDTTSTLVATLSGKYAVQYYTAQPCVLHRDTFIVKPVYFSLYLGEDISSCNNSSVTLEAAVPGATYLWSDGSTRASIQAKKTDQYWVEVTQSGCSAADSIDVVITDLTQDLGADLILCLEGGDPPAILKALAPFGAGIQWSTGSTEEQIAVSDTGTYWVKVTQGACEGTDSVHLDRQYCDCPILFPNAFSPNGDGKNDVFLPAFTESCPISSFKMQVYNQWGTMIFVSYKPDQGWDGYYNGQPADLDTYMYRVEMKLGLKDKLIVKSGDLLLLR